VKVGDPFADQARCRTDTYVSIYPVGKIGPRTAAKFANRNHCIAILKCISRLKFALAPHMMGRGKERKGNLRLPVSYSTTAGRSSFVGHRNLGGIGGPVPSPPRVERPTNAIQIIQ
jgi:hypothetical protein